MGSTGAAGAAVPMAAAPRFETGLPPFTETGGLLAAREGGFALGAAFETGFFESGAAEVPAYVSYRL